MTKEEFKEKMCKDCVNYCKVCKEEAIQEKTIDGVQVIRCRNYHKWSDCMTKSCRACGMCGEKE